MFYERKTFLIEGRDNVQAWARGLKLISSQPEIIAGEDFMGNAKMTKDANLVIELDEDAVEAIQQGVIHPTFEQGFQAICEYDKEFTYKYVREQSKAEPKKQFIYNYMDRIVNYPMPTVYLYQGKLITFDIPEKYFTKMDGGYTGGIDQLKILHDSIRNDGISRRHQLITWIPGIDLFSANPPCLQRIWIRVMIPKSEYHKYCPIPVEVHIEYRSWDFGRAILSNLYGLINCLYRYIFGNLTEEDEYVKDKKGEFILNPHNVIDYKIEKLVLFGNSCHVYEDAYNLFRKV